MFSAIMEKIIDILDANTLIQEVFDYEAEQLKGDPAAIVVPSNNDSDYNTTQENVRIYAFAIRVYVKRTSPRNQQTADRIMRDVASSIIDDFDKYYTFGTTGTDGSSLPGGAISSPTGYTYLQTFAVPSAWGYSGREDEYRSCEITIRCYVSVDLSNIS